MRGRQESSLSMKHPLGCFVWMISIQMIHAFSMRATRRRLTFVSSGKLLSSSSLSQRARKHMSTSCLSMIYAPPGSGYASPEDEESELPDSYVPMMEYPGTMRPGRTPENMPFHDLPIADSDPDPVPWPHFQQIEWHHRWDPPHPHPIPMEEFIEQQGRWATPELEAAMRAGFRRDIRKRQEMEDDKKRDNVIIDDDDDGDGSELPQDLGDGMFGKLGSSASIAITAAATAPPATREDSDDQTDVGDDDDDGGFDDFLLDLGLDADDDQDYDAQGGNNRVPMKADSPPKPNLPKSSLEDVIESFDDDDDDDMEVETDTGTDVTASISVDDDDDLDLGLDDDDDIEGDDGVSTVPLEDFGGDDNLDQEDFFDDGGFDYDDGDGGDWDGGDSW